MLAAIKTGVPREIVVGQCERPSLEQDEVLIQVEYCGVCGSDLHAYTHSKGYEFVKTPIILGHEIAGRVVEVKDSSLEEWVGKKVIVESMHYCNACENCRMGRKQICLHNRVIGLHFNGGMSEFVKSKSLYVREIPSGLSSRIAVLSEPLSIAVHAVKTVGDVRKDQTVLVQGPGIIGFFTGLVCVEAGARVILAGLEKDYEHRLSKCSDFGMIPHVVDRESLHEKVDVVFECSGSVSAVQEGFRHLKKGGKVVIVALYEHATPLFLTDLVRNEWPILTSYGCNPEDYDVSFRILKRYSGLLERMISIYPLEKANQAFLDALEQRVLKPVLQCSPERPVTGGR